MQGGKVLPRIRAGRDFACPGAGTPLCPCRRRGVPEPSSTRAFAAMLAKTQAAHCPQGWCVRCRIRPPRRPRSLPRRRCRTAGRRPGVLPVPSLILDLSGFAGSRPEAPDQSDDVVGGFAPAGGLRTVFDYVNEVEDASSTWAADSPRAAPQLLTVAVAKRHWARFREGGAGRREADMPSGAARKPCPDHPGPAGCAVAQEDVVMEAGRVPAPAWPGNFRNCPPRRQHLPSRSSSRSMLRHLRPGTSQRDDRRQPGRYPGGESWCPAPCRQRGTLHIKLRCRERDLVFGAPGARRWRTVAGTSPPNLSAPVRSAATERPLAGFGLPPGRRHPRVRCVSPAQEIRFPGTFPPGPRSGRRGRTPDRKTRP